MLLGLGLFALYNYKTTSSHAKGSRLLIDSFDNDFRSNLGTQWRGVSDQVMGGISDVSVVRETIDGRKCLRLSGDVRLDNNGGFIQAALDLAPHGKTFDARVYTGIRLSVRGNDEDYSVHLRTPDNVRPWQSYRAQFQTDTAWQTIELPFESFAPYRLQSPLNASRLRRVALVAVGREFRADLAVSEISFYR